jgi:hypothetical protein
LLLQTAIKEIFSNKNESHQRLWEFTALAVILFLALFLFLVGGVSYLSFVGRVLFVLFLPGFAVLQALTSEHFDFLEKLILSPIIGVAYTSLVALYLSVSNTPINQYTIILSALALSIPLLLYSWRKGKLKTSFKLTAKPLVYFLLMLVIVASIVLISFPWPKNGVLVPMGDDPVTSSLAATLIVEQGKIPQSWAPYFPEQSQFTYPPGYPSVMAFLYLLDPSLSMPVLVSLFALFFAIIPAEIFVVTRKVLQNDRIALCAAAFSSLLSVGLSVMVINGRFPALVGLALTINLLIFSYLYSTTGKRSLLLLAGATLASLFLAYTVSFITAALFVILFFAFCFVFSSKRKQAVLGGAAVLGLGVGLSLPWVLNIVSRLTIQIPTREYLALLVWFNESSLRSAFGFSNVFMYWGYWMLLFVTVGTLAVLVRKRSARFLLAWFLSIFVFMLNEFLRIPFPGWYYLQNAAFLNPTLSFPLSVLAAIFIVKLYDFLKTKVQFSPKKAVKTYLPFLLVAGVVLAAFYVEGQPIVAQVELRTDRISTADFDAINWISNNTATDAVIFNDHWVGTASIWIPVMSHRRIVMPLLSISEVGWSNTMLTRQDESLIVAHAPNSTEALAILKNYNVTYVYLSNKVSTQVVQWRQNYNPQLFLQSTHYELAFNEDNAWIFKVIY